MDIMWNTKESSSAVYTPADKSLTKMYGAKTKRKTNDVHFHKLIMPHTLGGTDRSKFPQVIFPMYVICRMQKAEGKTKRMFLSLHIHSFLKKSHADYN